MACVCMGLGEVGLALWLLLAGAVGYVLAKFKKKKGSNGGKDE